MGELSSYKYNFPPRCNSLLAGRLLAIDSTLLSASGDRGNYESQLLNAVTCRIKSKLRQTSILVDA